MSVLPLTNQETSLVNLMASSSYFKENNREIGYSYFSSCSPEHQGKVYEQVWLDQGRPIHDLQHGEHAFHDQFNKFTWNHEKVKAIDSVVSNIIQKNQDKYREDQQKLNCNSGYWYKTPEQQRRDEEFGRETNRVRDNLYKSIEKYGNEKLPFELSKEAQISIIAAIGVAYMAIQFARH